MAKVIYSDDALEDLERIIEFLISSSPDAAAAAIGRIRQAIEVLSDHPVLGRRVDGLRRELVISRGASGYLALYRFDEGGDLVRILRIRHQREAGYRD